MKRIVVASAVMGALATVAAACAKAPAETDTESVRTVQAPVGAADAGDAGDAALNCPAPSVCCHTIGTGICGCTTGPCNGVYNHPTYDELVADRFCVGGHTLDCAAPDPPGTPPYPKPKLDPILP